MSKPHFWTRKEIALLGADTDSAVALRLGVSRAMVYVERRKRNIPAHGRSHHPHCAWGETELGLLRNYSDAEVAKLTGRPEKEILAKRREIRA
ncbi:MAG TPA: hypothetical protein VFE46_13460 [Pirellulales bacterium]|jgi:hypothetical protein|nr:hypothetical protein [Pirellulales bacterium]